MSHVDTSAMGGGKRGGRVSHDFELNITSIIDCFVVLISFLLISSTFIAIGLMDAGIQAGQPAPSTATTPPPVTVTIELAASNIIKVRLSGKSSERSEIQATQGKWDLVRLQDKLTEIKKSWPTVDGVTLTAGSDVEYRDVVQGMEVIRKTIPNVLLGEF